MTADKFEAIAGDVLAWNGITSAPHRFGAVEFNLIVDGRSTEIGHVHGGSLVDILFSVRVREVLVAEGRARPHHILPETGWISYLVRTEDDVPGAVWLLRLSYLCTLAKSHPSTDLGAEIDALHISDVLRAAAFSGPSTSRPDMVE